MSPDLLRGTPTIETEKHMLLRKKIEARAGKIRYGLAAILLGLPLPIVILAFLWGGCR